MAYEFLSPEWVAAARAVGEEYADRVPPPAISVRVNQVVTDTPHGGQIDAHLDTSSGTTVMGLGHLEAPDVTITVDYATAKALFVDQDPQAAMQAFLAGKIKVDGDVAKLMALQGQRLQPDPVAAEAAERIRALTAD